MKNTKTTFGALGALAVFRLNGTDWVKRSTRTASIVGNPTRRFYFSKNERVLWLTAEY